ncbi:MAG TPA: hypothetical protein VK190_03605 [Pseudoneobacillus sp.]|nr:hypothetical protein [Pseudoneobacillus sp.]
MPNKKKFVALIVVLMMIPVLTTGCFASWGNSKALKGGYFTNNKGTYVVLNESGSKIMDCWILRDTFVESEANSDGLRFADEYGNGIVVQGDAKIIRINNPIDLNKYIEYHVETDLIPYDEFYKTKKGIK